MKDKSTDDYDVNDLKRVIKLQALARAKKERGKQQRKVDAFFVIYWLCILVECWLWLSVIEQKSVIKLQLLSSMFEKEEGMEQLTFCVL